MTNQDNNATRYKLLFPQADEMKRFLCVLIGYLSWQDGDILSPQDPAWQDFCFAK